MINIYISSLAFLGKTPEEMIQIANEHQWGLEFSSCMPFRKDMEEIYLGAGIKRMPHNYFPAPAEPFVLNLASSDAVIRAKSISHCKNGLSLAKQSQAPFFAAHAGFCVDPNPSELGKKIQFANDFKKKDNWELFLSSLENILYTARELEIDFLIENNVLAPFNFSDGVNPFLCSESSDILNLFSSITDNRLGLLLDTAHLKVSCHTLKLDLHNELNKIIPFIRGVHHSDNNGIEDNNEPLNTGYWFLPFMKSFRAIGHVLEVRNLSVSQIKHQIALLK